MPARRWTLAGAAIAATSLVAAAVAVAHGGDASLIHACVKNGNGSVRIVQPTTNCQSTETATDWGITGPAGPPGPAGLSAAYTDTGVASAVPSLSAGTPANIVEVTVPAGNYVAIGTVQAADVSSPFVGYQFQCRVTVNGTVTGQGTDVLVPVSGATVSVSISGTLSAVPANGRIGISCGTGGSGTAINALGILQVIAVGTVFRQ